MSRTMIVGYLTALAAVLALPQVLALIPDYVGIAAIISGIAVVAIRYFEGNFGANLLSLVAIAGLVAGILDVQTLIEVIPAVWMRYVLAIQGILTLLTRYTAGTSATDKALPVGFLFHKTAPGEVQT